MIFSLNILKSQIVR